MFNIKKDNSWRGYQSDYINSKKRKALILKVARAVAGVLFILLVILSIGFIRDIIKDHTDIDPEPLKQESVSQKRQPDMDQISRRELSFMINDTDFCQSDKNIFFVNTPDQNYKITTSIDVYLQEYLLSSLKKLKRKKRGKPQRIAIVVIEPDTGKIIAMTGFDLAKPKQNPCIESDYPAASLFKIITAAAAVETLNYTPKTRLYFNGDKYTLYKRQLKDVKNKYTYRVSFSRAFAESINPVFGKIGKNYLGREKLEIYADLFGFNKIVKTEIPFYSGFFQINDNEYHLAELGCGFNNDTKISPLFAAMFSGAIINSGDIMTPSLVEHVTNGDGKVVYKNQKATYKTAISPETASTLISLMQTTISRGTARKTFYGSSRDKILSKLLIGGKTGSLYNKKHTVKYDWFTGFAKDKKTDRKISMAIVVGHRKYIGTRATSYAKMILKQYYKTDHTKAAYF